MKSATTQTPVFTASQALDSIKEHIENALQESEDTIRAIPERGNYFDSEHGYGIAMHNAWAVLNNKIGKPDKHAALIDFMIRAEMESRCVFMAQAHSDHPFYEMGRLTAVTEIARFARNAYERTNAR